MKIGEFVREKRSEKGIGQRGLANICNCSAMQVHRIEVGRNHPSIEFLLLFCEYFKLPLYEVLKYILPSQDIDIEARLQLEREQEFHWKRIYNSYRKLSFEQIMKNYLKNSIKLHKARECNCSATQLLRLANGERHFPKNVLLLWHLANGLNLPIGLLLEKEYPNFQVNYAGFHLPEREYLVLEENKKKECF